MPLTVEAEPLFSVTQQSSGTRRRSEAGREETEKPGEKEQSSWTR